MPVRRFDLDPHSCGAPAPGTAQIDGLSGIHWGRNTIGMQRVTPREKSSLPHQLNGRLAPTAISLTVLTSLLLACTPPTPPAATSAPAASAVAKAAASAAPSASPSPAAISQAAATPASPATGQIVIVNEAEPDTIVPKDGGQRSWFVLDNVYDHLVGRDYAAGVGKIVPQLAESWSRVNDHTWRFQLRRDVKFTNGEVFNADAVVTAIEDMADPRKPGVAASDYGTLKSANKIDDFTADVITGDPDPILPERLVHFAIPAPNWLKTSSPEAIATQAVGSGPYILAEYQKGSHLLFKVNPNYWGTDKPKTTEVKLLGRSEQAVRGAMLQAGEAHLAFNIAPELANQAPRTIIQQTHDAPTVRINTEHPVLRDVRVRQAIIEAVDTQGMITALYPGGLGVPLNGHVIRQGSVGWNPNLKPYPYQPDESKRLLQEARAVGTPIELVDRPGQFPRAGEVGELIVNWLNQVGFKTTLRHLEAGPFLDAFRSVKPDQQRTDLQLTSISDPVLDSSRAIDVYYACGGRYHIGCDPEFDRRYDEARVLMGDARDKAFRDLWEYTYDKYWYMPLFGLNWIHGASPSLQWTPRDDGLVLFTEMALNP
jgi:peptide/nickel transport system substrate-binding protein